VDTAWKPLLPTRVLSPPETFPGKAVRLFREKVRGQIAFVRRCQWWIDDVVVWVAPDTRHLVFFYELCAVSLFVAAILNVTNFDASVASVVAIVMLLVLIGSTLALTLEALVPRWETQLLTSFWKCLIVPPILVFWLPGTALYVAWRTLLLIIQLSLFFFLALVFGARHRIQQLRKVYVCPVRKCGDTSLPAHVCRSCGHPHDDLYPNLYGLFWHRCAKCGASLPTLNVLGRSGLGRRCRHCRLPRSYRTLPTRLIQLVGGVSSGKSCYLTMAIHQILDGEARDFGVFGALDDAEQKKAFLRQWDDFAHGEVVAKTIEVPKAGFCTSNLTQESHSNYTYTTDPEKNTSRLPPWIRCSTSLSSMESSFLSIR